MLPTLSISLVAFILDKRPKEVKTAPIAATVPANPIKPLVISSGLILPIILTAAASINKVAPICIIVVFNPLISIPLVSLFNFMEASSILLTANISATSIPANSPIVATAPYSFSVSTNVSAIIAPTNIARDSATRFKALVFISKANESNTLAKLFSTTANPAITLLRLLIPSSKVFTKLKNRFAITIAIVTGIIPSKYFQSKSFKISLSFDTPFLRPSKTLSNLMLILVPLKAFLIACTTDFMALTTIEIADLIPLQIPSTIFTPFSYPHFEGE